MQENLKKKYGITEEELSRGMDILAKCLLNLPSGKIFVAFCEFLMTADIKEDEN